MHHEALRTLGARSRAAPPFLTERERHDPALTSWWSGQDLPAAITALAAERQVLLFFQAWRRDARGWLRQDSPGHEVSLDGDWTDVVERMRVAALAAAASFTPADGTV